VLLDTEKSKNVGQGGASNAQITRWRYARWRGRTDLFFLAHDILGYNEKNYNFSINLPVHGPLINMMQKFPITQEEMTKYDVVRPWAAGGCIYPYGGKPPISRKLLPGKRKRLILAPRSWMKTTLNCVAGTIQWLLNYPDMAILMVQSSTEKAEKNLHEIKSHFIHNALFREIYPDYCPVKIKGDWGNRTEVTLPNRQNKNRKEPSIMTASVDKKTAGLHVELIKCSDIVEEGNTRTVGQMMQTAYAFEMFQKLLVDPDDFIDVEGTRYHGGDLYGKIIKEERDSPIEDREWEIYVQSLYKKDTKGTLYTFGPEEMDLPYLRDEKGQFVSWWPERFPVAAQEKIRRRSPEAEEVFATQMLNNPLDVEGGQAFDPKDMVWIDRSEFDKVKVVFRTVTVDTAETQNDRSDFTAVTTCAWDRGGRCYVEDIRYGRMLQDEIIAHLFDVWQKYSPISIKIEETGYVRGLKPSISRYSEKLGIFPVWDFIPRDTQVSKTERIRGIQPWYKSGDLRFLSDLRYKQELKDQFGEFPKSRYDDILDTIADQFQNREHFGRLASRPTPDETYMKIKERFYYGEEESEKYDEVRKLTGL
jgi:predicted phage terminase large subunit-like protein